jgi:hypothetical protein
MNDHIRARLSVAAAALCDDQLHDRLWLRGARLSPDELNFDDAVLVVIDELEMLDPTIRIDDIFVDEWELAAFVRLSGALESLVAAIGKYGGFEDAVRSGPLWQECVVAARSLKGLLCE